MARRRALARVSGRSQQFPAGDALALAGALDEAAIVTLASAAAVAIGAAQANTIQISGTTTITSFDTVASGAVRRLVFSGALTLTHNATKLILPGAANITTAAGDVATFVSLGSGNWRCVGYQLAAGGGSAGPLTKYFESSQLTITSNGSATVAHGLGANPKIIFVHMVCVADGNGYNVGDRVSIPMGYSMVYEASTSSVRTSIVNTISFDASNIYLSYATRFFLTNKTNANGAAANSEYAITSGFKLVIGALA